MPPRPYHLPIFGAPPSEIREALSQFANAFDPGFTVKLTSANQYTRQKLSVALATVRKEIWDKLTDGHTYFLDDGHSLREMRAIRPGPYSRRAPHPEILGHSLEDAQIHIQRSASSLPLVDDFRSYDDNDDPRGMRSGITIGSEVNRRKWFWLNNGTSMMIGRPLERKIKADHIERFRSLIQDAFKNSLVSLK